jgi:hypothetical protein
MQRFRWAAVLVTALWLAGCAGPKIPYDRSVAEVKRIGIVTPSFPDGASVVLASSIGQSFGLVGLLIDAGMQSDRESKFNTVLERYKFSVQDEFLQALAATLQARGYEVAMVPTARNGTDFLEHYPIGPKVDAYLDLVTTNYGYVAAGISASTPYRPSFGVRARLVSAKGAAVLMQDAVVYNPIRPVAVNAVTIAPEPAYGFKDFDALVLGGERAVKGLEAAARQSAETVGKLLQ